MGNAFKLFRNNYYSDAVCKQLNNKLVVITGCDSGLGYSLSLKCRNLGLTVVSGCLDLKSEGAKNLTDLCHVCHLDLMKLNSITNLAEKINNMTRDEGKGMWYFKSLLKDLMLLLRKKSQDKNFSTFPPELYAVVNNAGVMIFGEFEWLTQVQILQQVQVNMLGSFHMAKTFLPLLRKSRGRLINISSHCAITNLPNLTVYGATKAAVQSWSEGLRIEQKKYGVKVINFIPGSFATKSNIMASQELHSKQMENLLTEEYKKMYGDYFNDFNLYLRHVSSERKKPLVPIDDEKLYEKFTKALLSDNPKALYKHEPWRYFFYYNSFRFVPLWLKDFLIEKFMKFPKFKPNSSSNFIN